MKKAGEREEAFLKILELSWLWLYICRLSGEIVSKQELETRAQIIAFLEDLLTKWVQMVFSNHVALQYDSDVEQRQGYHRGS